MKVPFFELNYGEEERDAVLDTLDSEWISMGPKCERLEDEFSDAHGVKHGVSLANCTAALHLGLRALEVGPDDEVIVPSLTFVATANAVLMNGATPVFADVASVDEDWTIDPEDVACKITPKTAAIIGMHYGGHGADMSALRDLADAHDLKLVEDACHAPLGKRGERMLGTFGDVACYSFYANKNMSAAEGGMLLTDDEGIAEHVRLLRSHGMTTSAYERVQGREFYDVLEFGYNYRMDDIRAALALEQLWKLPDDIAHRARVAERYRTNLHDLPGVTLPFTTYEGRSVNHVFGLLTNHPDRAQLREDLKAKGVATSMHYPPVHQFGCYDSYATPLPKTEDIGQREISLPIFYGMTMGQVDYVCDCLAECLEDVERHAQTGPSA